jgi:CRISPR-associated protein Cas1
MDEIPFYAINAYVYCPYRYYLEHVQGIFADNEHITEGRFIHSLKNKDSRWGSKTKRSGVYVGSHTYGIYGYIDYVNQDDESAYPVEIKKSSSRTLYVNDRMQVVAEAVALEETLGIRVSRGVVKYEGSGKRFNVSCDEKAREKLAAVLKDMRSILQGISLPKPRRTTKCNGCSLVDKCLPEDKNLKKSVTPLSERKDSLYILQQGATVGKTGKSFSVSFNGETVTRVPAFSTARIMLYGMSSITTPAIRLAVEENIPVNYLTMTGSFVAKVESATGKNVRLRKKQYSVLDSPEKSLDIAKRVIEAKIFNQRTSLRRLSRSSKIKASSDSLKRFQALALKAKDVDSLRGIEGMASEEYFSQLALMIPKEYSFSGRNRRPPKDEVNALMSFAYSLLMTEILGQLEASGLDPYFGFMHSTAYGKPALALDMMEHFRPVMDVMIRNLLSSKRLAKTDFVIQSEGVFLKEKAKKTFLEAYRQRTLQKTTHQLVEGKIEYVRLFEMEARMLCKELLGEAAYEPYRWQA